MISKNIKYWCKIRNTTLKALAESLYVSPGTLSYWINTDAVPPYILKRIAKLLRVPVEELVK